MTVTSVVPLDKRRSKVFLEEDFAFVLYKGELKKYQIEEGSDLSWEQHREIMTLILYKRARERSVHILKNSDKTELELRNKLREGFFPEEAVDAAIKWLKEYGYVEDTRYAQRYIECHRNRNSRRQICYELERKGIARDTVTGLMEDSPVDEEQQIRTLLKKKHYCKETADAKELTRIMAALGRKGFSFEVIRKVMSGNSENGDW